MCKVEVGPKTEECKKGGRCKTVSHLGAKRNLKLVQKGRNKKGVDAEEFRTWVQKKKFGRSAPHHLCKILNTPLSAGP